MFYRFVVAYCIALSTYMLLDALWFLLMFKKFYAPRLEHLLSEKVDWWAIGLFYIVYILGILYFVVIPHMGNPLKALGSGALLGLVAYGTYDLVNKAALKEWPCDLTMVDILWGTLVTGITSLIVTILLKYIVINKLES